MRKVIFSVALAVLALGVALSPVTAAAFTFDFNSLADGASNATIQTYMQGVLPGTTISGAAASKFYAGDNHVVGSVSGSTVTPITLGTSNGAIGNNTDVAHGGANDTFIMNQLDVTTTITINFSSAVNLVGFDWEIFPDANCQSTGSCSETPDLTFKINGTEVAGSPFLGVAPGSNSTYLHSPDSGSVNNELALQRIGHYAVGASAVTQLSFEDWPPAIGIDNLVVDTFVPPGGNLVPEPSTLLLLGAGLVGLAARQRRARAARNRGI
jgi:hypothetical protein